MGWVDGGLGEGDLTRATAEVVAPVPERLRASVLAEQALEVARAIAPQDHGHDVAGAGGHCGIEKIGGLFQLEGGASLAA